MSKNGKYLAVLLAFVLMSFLAVDLRAQEEVWFAKGQKSLFSGKYEDAADSFTNVITKDPKNKSAWNNRGLAYLYMGEFAASASDFSKAIELDSSDADCWNNRGLANIYIGNIEEAISDLDRAIKLDPKFSEAYMNRGTAYIEYLNYPQALKDLDESISLSGKTPNPNAYYERGRAKYKSLKENESIKDFSEAIKLGLKNSKIFISRGNAYFKTQDYKNAITDYTKALELEPGNTEAINNRAVSYEKTGQKDKADKDRAFLNERKEAYLKNFPSLDSMKFKTFENSSKEYSMVLPETWNERNITTQYSNDMLVTKEKINTDTSYYMVGARMSLNKGMSENYSVRTVEEILDFWKGSVAKNGQDYHVYDLISQKMMTRNGISGILNKVRVQFTKKSFPVIMYELAFARENTLFYAYFQAPEVQFEYYQKIFDKAVDSFVWK